MIVTFDCRCNSYLSINDLDCRFTAKKLKYKLQAEMAEVMLQDMDNVKPETSHNSDTCHETTDVVN